MGNRLLISSGTPSLLDLLVAGQAAVGVTPIIDTAVSTLDAAVDVIWLAAARRVKVKVTNHGLTGAAAILRLREGAGDELARAAVRDRTVVADEQLGRHRPMPSSWHRAPVRSRWPRARFHFEIHFRIAASSTKAK